MRSWRSIPLAVFSIDHTSYACDRDCEDYTEDATERGACEHYDEDEKRREVEGFAHDLRNEEIVLGELDRDVESDDHECCFPADPEPNDKGRDERHNRSYIGNELHDTSDERESKSLPCRESEYELCEGESDIGDGEDTHTEEECCLDPSIADALDGVVVIRYVLVDLRWGNVEDEFSDHSPLEYHEKCRDCDECPVRDHSTHSTNDRYTTTGERWYLTRDDRLDISCILLDDVERVLDIILSENEKYNLLYIWMEMKSWNSLFQINALCIGYPILHKRCGNTYIVNHNRYQCPDNNTSQKKYHDIDSNDSDPRINSTFFSFINQWTHEDREKSWYYEHQDNGGKDIEDIDPSKDCEKEEYFLGPQWEFCMHREEEYDMCIIRNTLALQMFLPFKSTDSLSNESYEICNTFLIDLELFLIQRCTRIFSNIF